MYIIITDMIWDVEKFLNSQVHITKEYQTPKMIRQNDSTLNLVNQLTGRSKWMKINWYLYHKF